MKRHDPKKNRELHGKANSGNNAQDLPTAQEKGNKSDILLSSSSKPRMD